MLDKIILIAKIALPTLSTLFAILTWLQKRQLQKLTNARLWLLFKKQQNAYGMTQYILKSYKEKHGSNLDKDILEWAAKAESFDQNILEDIMSNIFALDDKMSLEKINRYLSEGKISQYDKNLFEMMINEPPELSFIQKCYRFLGIPI